MPPRTCEPVPALAEQVNAATESELRTFLAACCDVPDWVDAVADGRPYADSAALLDHADLAARTFGAADVDRALARHPRIGEGAEGGTQEARWSRTEQASVLQDDGTAATLADVNRRYENRFGRVFLICATGLSTEEILAAAHERLHNTDDAEVAVVADELRKIALVRLQRGPAA